MKELLLTRKEAIETEQNRLVQIQQQLFAQINQVQSRQEYLQGAMGENALQLEAIEKNESEAKERRAARKTR